MMIDNLKANENIHPNSREIELLKADFPQFFNKDGEFCIDRFKKMLHSSDITLSKEGYELNFLGKSYARYLSSTKAETFISPDTAENEKEENKNSENLYIVGDNLDALKHLLGSYAGKIKCIYIDPPYNTGSDGFVYQDNFSFNAKELADTIGIEEEEAERIINLKGKSSHSAWLTFMYPRLILARELLSDDGVIFISIDDNEQANLKIACDEVFGEENCLTTITRATGTPTGGGFDGFVNELDYCLVYAKQLEKTVVHGLSMDNESAEIYNQVDEEGNRYLTRSLRRTGGEDRREDRPTMFYSLEAPDGSEVYPYGPTGYESRWMCSKETFENLSMQGLIEWKKLIKNNEEVWHPYQKYYLEGRLKKAGNIWKFLDFKESLWEENVGNKKATIEIKNLLEGKYFETPKPIEMMKKIQTIVMNSGSIILDFFSGSATTAHALMQLNAEDGGNRKFILVQLPEQIKEDKPAYKAGYRTIDEIGRERIRRAAKKIQEETNADIDYGFKTFYLNELKEDVLTNLLSFDDNPKLILDDTVGIFDREKAKGKDAILTTYLVLDGYGLSIKAEEYKLFTYIADRIEGSLYIIEQGLQSEDVMELIRRIENLELDITRVVIYTSSIHFHVLHELKKNLANLRNNKRVELIERY
nr:DNA methyltransferase [uncultured Oribacterium sp.]